MGRSGFSISGRDPPALNKAYVEGMRAKNPRSWLRHHVYRCAVALGYPPDFSKSGVLVHLRLNSRARWHSAIVCRQYATKSGSSRPRGLRKRQRGLVGRVASPCSVASAMGHGAKLRP